MREKAIIRSLWLSFQYIKEMKVNKTRFCPSPTGLLHLGNLRTSLFSSLLAKKDNGSFLLRIEDTDLERSKKEFSVAICNDLKWMALDWDEGPEVGGKEDSYYQSERIDLYEEFYNTLLEKDLIYPCFTSEEELKIIRRNQIASGQPPRYTGVWSNATEEEVIEAAKNARVHKNIIDFKNGYDTVLGERGITLSGGQKQRVSIARAIIKSPEILLFDDCLSAVDTETEEKILKNLERVSKNKTTIIVSHRISSAKNADKIIVLDEGKIIQAGRHQTLKKTEGYYKDLYRKQRSEKEM